MDVDADHALATRLDQIAEIEAKLDPALRRRGRIVADALTIAIVAPLAFAADWHVTRPFVMLSLMVGALFLNRVVPWITERSLRRELDDLTGEEDDGPR